MIEDSEYECSLDAEALLKAKEELYEEPNDRLSSVQKFREWILDQKHLTCRTDMKFLLRYLRGAKFSQLRARELLENTMGAMTSIPTWFRSIDTREPGIQAYIKLGVSFPLPKRDQHNRRILVIRPGAISVKNPHYSVDNEMRSAFCIASLISREELTQVYGYVLVFDFTGFSVKHVKASWSQENSRKQSKVWQDCTPGRVKAFHIYNAGTFFEIMMSFSRPFMKKKFLQRFHVHDNLESLYKHVPKECLPQEYLPDDDTSQVDSTRSIIDDIVRRVSSDEYRQEIMDSTKSEFGFKKDMKPTDIPAQSFRKLAID